MDKSKFKTEIQQAHNEAMNGCHCDCHYGVILISFVIGYGAARLSKFIYRNFSTNKAVG